MQVFMVTYRYCREANAYNGLRLLTTIASNYEYAARCDILRLDSSSYNGSVPSDRIAQRSQVYGIPEWMEAESPREIGAIVDQAMGRTDIGETKV